MRVRSSGRAVGRARGGWRGESGAGTVVVLGVASAVLVAVLALAVALATLIADARAQAAADAGALSGASVTRAAVARGEEVAADAACESARTAVTAVGAVMLDCDVGVAGDVTVTVADRGGSASARAGWKGVDGGPG